MQQHVQGMFERAWALDDVRGEHRRNVLVQVDALKLGADAVAERSEMRVG
jgi:hypothetical protein